jgi:hypothetical protein
VPILVLERRARQAGVELEPPLAGVRVVIGDDDEVLPLFDRRAALVVRLDDRARG